MAVTSIASSAGAGASRATVLGVPLHREVADRGVPGVGRAPLRSGLSVFAVPRRSGTLPAYTRGAATRAMFANRDRCPRNDSRTVLRGPLRFFETISSASPLAGLSSL